MKGERLPANHQGFLGADAPGKARRRAPYCAPPLQDMRVRFDTDVPQLLGEEEPVPGIADNKQRGDGVQPSEARDCVAALDECAQFMPGRCERGTKLAANEAARCR